MLSGLQRDIEFWTVTVENIIFILHQVSPHASLEYIPVEAYRISWTPSSSPIEPLVFLSLAELFFFVLLVATYSWG